MAHAHGGCQDPRLSCVQPGGVVTVGPDQSWPRRSPGLPRGEAGGGGAAGAASPRGGAERCPLPLVAALWRTSPRQVTGPCCPVRSPSAACSPARPRLPHLGVCCFFLLSSGCFSSPTLLLKGQMARRCLGRRGQLSPWAAAPARPLPLPPASRQGLRSGRGAAGQGGGAAEQQEGRAGLSVARGLGAAAQRAEPRLGPTSGDSAAQQAAAPAGQTVLCRLQRGHAGPRLPSGQAGWPAEEAVEAGAAQGPSPRPEPRESGGGQGPPALPPTCREVRPRGRPALLSLRQAAEVTP